MSIFCFYQWIFVIFDEIKTGHLSHPENFGKNNETKFHKINEMQQFLYPLSSEFRMTLFIELFFIAFNAKKTTCLIENSYMRVGLKIFKKAIFFILDKTFKYFNNFFKRIFCFKIPFTEKSQIIKKHTIFEYFFIFGLIMMSVLMVSIAIVVILFQNVNIENNTQLVLLISELCGLVIISILCIYIVFLFFIFHKRSKLQIDHQVGFTEEIEQKVDFFFLIVSNLCHFVFFNIAFGGLIKSIVDKNDQSLNNLKIIQILSSFFKIIESPCQLFIIWICQSKISLLSGYIQILTLLNFSLWLFNTFTITMTINNKILRNVYGERIWEIIITILGPIYIFYRFHTCLILIKIKNKKYDST
jgi:hypothetical protein